MIRPSISGVLLALMTTATLCGQARADDRIWRYGASNFALEATQTGQVVISFRKVGNGLDREGVVPGTLIFQGTGDGLHLRGESYHFRKECGAMAFEVAGLYDLAAGLVFLSGRIPVRGKDCRVENTLPVTLRFEAPAGTPVLTAAGAIPAPVAAPPPAAPPAPSPSPAPASSPAPAPAPAPAPSPAMPAPVEPKPAPAPVQMSMAPAAPAQPAPPPASPPVIVARPAPPPPPPPVAAARPAPPPPPPPVAAARPVAPPPPVVAARPAADGGQAGFCARVSSYAETLRDWKRVDALNLAEMTAREQIAILQKRDAAYRARTIRDFTSESRRQAAVLGLSGWSATVTHIAPDKAGIQLAVTICPDALRVTESGIEDAKGFILFGVVPPGRGPWETTLDLKAGDRIVIDATYDPTRHKETGERLAEAQQATLGVRFIRVAKEAPRPEAATASPAAATTDNPAAAGQ